MRKGLIGGLTALAALTGAGAAEARFVCYAGAQADKFIARYLPGAVIPGDVKQGFSYGPHGRRHGFAHCHVPAMGERSDGGVSICNVRF